MSFLTKLFGKKKKKEFIPANPKDDNKAARVYEEEEGNIPLRFYEVEDLPKGFTPNKYLSCHPRWDSKPSMYITRNKYNEPKAITAKQRRSTNEIL